MSRIVMDCDLMKYRNSGLYYYCLNLGRHINQLLDEQGAERIKFYVPQAERNSFNGGSDTIVEKKYHKFVKPFLWNCKVWHAPFQTGRMIPQDNSSTRVVLTIHDLNHLHEGKPIEEQKHNLKKTQALIDRSDVIVCVSQFCKSDVIRHLNTGNKPIHVIYNGTSSLSTPKLSATSYKPTRPFLFSIGYVNRKKNFHTLICLLQQNELEFVVAGRLDELDYVNAIVLEARRRGLNDRFHILGPITDEEKSWYLKHCTAYVHPSLAEGFGIPVVEAMTFGKPLFLSHRTSLPEIAGDVAFYFKNFDPGHMQQVFLEGMHYYSLNGLGKRIKARGKAYNWREKAAEYIGVYNSLL
jgi:glycosyltransferase involved in cell wall biosynthesis